MFCCDDFMSGMKIITSISGSDNFISTSSELLDHDGRIFHRPRQLTPPQRFVIQTARLPKALHRHLWAEDSMHLGQTCKKCTMILRKKSLIELVEAGLWHGHSLIRLVFLVFGHIYSQFSVYTRLCGIVGLILSLLCLKSVVGPHGCFMYVL